MTRWTVSAKLIVPALFIALLVFVVCLIWRTTLDATGNPGDQARTITDDQRATWPIRNPFWTAGITFVVVLAVGHALVFVPWRDKPNGST